MVRHELHNDKHTKDLDGHDILGHLKDDERQFLSDITKYNMAPRSISTALKERDPETLSIVFVQYLKKKYEVQGV